MNNNKINLDIINNFHNLKLSKNFKNKSFDKITCLIQNKYFKFTIHNFYSLLKNFNNYDKDLISSKTIILVYLITYFKNDILSLNLEAEEKILYEKSYELVNILDTISYNNDLFENLIKKLNTFSIIFNYWKKKDYKSQIDIYCEIYHNYNNKINLINKNNNIEQDYQYYLEYLNNIKSISKQSIKNLVNYSNINYNVDNIINNYKFKEKIYDNSINQIIEKYLKNIFFYNLYNELNKSPPEYQQFKSIVIEINSYLNCIYLSTQKKKNEVWNEFISDSIDYEKIIYICKYLLEEIKNFDLDNKNSIFIQSYIYNLNNIYNYEFFCKTVINILFFSLEQLQIFLEIYK